MVPATIFVLADIGPVTTEFFLASGVTALLLPVGAIVADAVYPVSSRQRSVFFLSRLNGRSGIKRATWVLYNTLLVCGLLLFAAYVYRAGSTPLIELLTGQLDGKEARIARAEAGVGHAGYIFGIGLRFYMPMLFLLALLGFSIYRGFLRRGALGLGMVVAFLYCAWATDKTPVAALFLTAFMLVLIRLQEQPNIHTIKRSRHLHQPKRKYRRRLLAGGVLLVLLVFAYPVLIYMFKPVGQFGLDYAISSVFERVGYKPARNSYAAFEAIYSGWEHTYFRDISKLAWLFDWPYISLSTEIALYKGQSAYTNAPPTATGTFYAQGGWVVLCLGVFIAAGVFRCVENLLLRGRIKCAPNLALYALLMYGAFRFSQANFHTILFTETILPLLLLLGLWQLLRTTLSPKNSAIYRSGPVSTQA